MQMFNDQRQQINRFLYRNGTPITVSVLIVYVVLFFITLALPGIPILQNIIFSTQDWLPRFWTVFTWPVGDAAQQPISALFAIGWFYLFSSSLERTWGGRDYGLFLAAMASITALGMWLGSFLVGNGVASGLWMISGSLAVAWALINRGETINLFFVPLPAPAIGVLGAVLVWFYGGASYGNPLLGLFALLSCAAAYWYVTKGRYFSSRSSRTRGTSRRGDGYSLRTDSAARFRNIGQENTPSRTGWNPFRWWKDRQERKRLEDIFRRSGFTDDK
jgi:hypothetical protein